MILSADRPVQKIALTIGAGVAWGLPFVFEAAAPLVFVCLVPFLLLLVEGRLKRVVLASYVVGSIHTTVGILWLWGTWPPLPFVTGAYFGIFAALFGWALSRLLRQTRLPLILLVPPLYVAMEFLRTYVSLFRTTWLHLAYPLHDWTALIQVSKWTGHFGVTALVILVNVAVAEGIIAWRKSGTVFTARVAGSAGATLVLFLAALGFGVRVPPTSTEGPTLGVVQANFPLQVMTDYTRWDEVLEGHVDMTRERGGDGIDLWVWPESSYPGRIHARPEAARTVQALTRDLGTPLLFGCLGVKVVDGEERPTNTGFFVRPDGTWAGRYDKRVLVPFGETLPIVGAIPSLRKRIADALYRAVGFRPHIAPGEHTEPMSIPWRDREVKIGALICYEAVLPDLARSSRMAGAEILVNLSNESWFPRGEKHQLLSMAKFRAVECGVPLVRATTTGISCVISPRGVLVAAVEEGGRRVGVRGVLVAKVPLSGERPTFYARFGDLFCYLLFLAAGGVYVWGYRREVQPPAPMKAR